MAYEESNVLNGEDAAVVEIDGKLVSILSGEERDIPLNRLHLSPNNVRKKHDPSTIPELAAAIMAEGGLLNPLAVIPEKIKGSKARPARHRTPQGTWQSTPPCLLMCRCAAACSMPSAA